VPDVEDTCTRSPDTGASGHWLFLVAIISGPNLPLISDGAFLLYIITLAVQCPWRSSLANRRVATVGLILLLCCCWFLARTVSPYGTGLHTLSKPARFPVTVLDYVPFLIFFFVRSLLPFSRREILHTLWALLLANLLHFPLAIAQKFLSWTCSCSWKVLGLQVVRLMIRPLHKGRVEAGFDNGNILACFLVFCLLAAGALLTWYLGQQRQPSPGRRPSIRWPVWLTLAVAILCAGLMIVWSGSRASWVVLAVVLAVYARVAGVRWRYILVPLLLLVLLVGAAMVELGPPTKVARKIVPKIVWGRLTGLAELKPSNLSWRLQVFGLGVDMVQERPWIGWGLGNFAPEAERRHGSVVNHAHNIFLQLATETGIPFAVLFSAVIGAVFLAAGKRLWTLPRDRWRTVLIAHYLAAIATVLLHQLSLTMLHANQLEMIFWWCLAVPYSLVLEQLSSEPVTTPPEQALTP